MTNKAVTARSVVPMSRNMWMWTAVFFLLAFVLYIKTTSGTFLFDDNSEFIASAHRLGITHPPGYPIFSLFGKLFSFLPVGSIFFAVNLSSAFAGACGVSLVFILVWRMTGLWSAAASAVIVTGIARTFWIQTGQAEVYALNFFFMFLILNIILTLLYSRTKFRTIALLVLTGAVAMINHYSIALMVPVCAILFFISYKYDLKRIFKIAAPLLLFAIIGLSIYAYLPLRSAASPTIMWQEQVTIKGFIKHVQGVDRRTTVPSVPFNNKLKFVKHYSQLLSEQWTPWILIFVAIGLIGMIFIRWPGSGWFALLGLFFLSGFVLLLNYLFGPRSAFVVSVFHISSMSLIGVFAGLGIGTIELFLRKYTLPWQPVFAIFVALAAWTMIMNLEFTDHSQLLTATNFGKNLLRNVERDGIIFSRLETESFPIASMRAGAGMRSDILLFGNQGDDSSIITGESTEIEFDSEYQDVTSLERTIFEKEIYNRPVYYTFLRRLETQPGVSLYPDGLMYKINPNMKKLARSNPWDRIDMSGIDINYSGYDYIEKNVIGKYYLRMSERLLNEGKGEEAKLRLQRILEFNPESRFLRMEVAGLYMSLGQIKLAREQYEEALAVDSENVELSIDTMSIYNNLSFIYGKLGEEQKALEMIETAVRLAPNIPIFLLNLGQTYWHMDRCDDAVKTLLKAIEYGVGSSSVYNILGICYEKAEDYEKADEAYSKSISFEQPLPEAFRDYGVFNTYIMNNPEKAVKMLTHYMQLKPDAEDAVVIRANLGFLNKGLERYEAAILNFEIAARLSGDIEPRKTAILRSALASCYEALGILDGTVEEYEKGTKFAWYYPEILMNYGTFLYKNSLDRQKAITILEQYIQLNSTAPDTIIAVEMISSLKANSKY